MKFSFFQSKLETFQHFNLGSDFKRKNGDNVTLCLIGNLKIRRQSL